MIPSKNWWFLAVPSDVGTINKPVSAAPKLTRETQEAQHVFLFCVKIMQKIDLIVIFFIVHRSTLKGDFCVLRTKRLDGIWEHLLIHDKPADLYSFVCNAMMNVCNCHNSERWRKEVCNVILVAQFNHLAAVT